MLSFENKKRSQSKQSGPNLNNVLLLLSVSESTNRSLNQSHSLILQRKLISPNPHAIGSTSRRVSNSNFPGDPIDLSLSLAVSSDQHCSIVSRKFCDSTFESAFPFQLCDTSFFNARGQSDDSQCYGRKARVYANGVHNLAWF